MTNIIIKGNTVETETKPELKRLLSIFSQFEGRKKLSLKNGCSSFENTPHNLSLWMYAFPESKVNNLNEGLEIFEKFSQPNKRPLFKFKREGRWWQQKAHEKFIYNLKNNKFPVFAFIYDPGSGKTKSAIDAAVYLYCENIIDAVIVVSPNMLVADQWITKQLPSDVHDDISYSAWLWDKTKKGEKTYDEFINSNKLKFFSLNIDAAKTPKGNKLLNEYIKKHKGRVCFILDESQLAKNPASGRHKEIDKLMSKCEYRIILTGTLIAKNLVDAYAQFRLLDPRILGFKYISTFKAQFCVMRWNGFGHEIIGHKNVEKFYKLIEPYSFRVSKDELGYEKLFDTFEFTMSKEQKEVFQSLKKDFVAKLDSGEFMTVGNALAATVRMQQVTCGYLPLEDGTVQKFPNTRLEALEAWSEQMEDEKLVIWCRFLDDARVIMEHFGDICVDLSGNVTPDERIVSKNRFINDSKIKYAVGTPDSSGTGVDGLQDVCNRAIYYSNSYNSILRQQSEDRTSRLNGSATSFYTDLVCKGGIDKKILANLQSKKDLAKLTLDDVRKMFEEDDE
jgi:SNF2 family DNA or RNA helicase